MGALWTLAAGPLLLACALSEQEALPPGDATAVPPAPFVDPRLGALTTLDGYHPFEPPADRAAWEARSSRVRRQILVAAGLWPLPPRTPLEPVIRGAIDRGEYTVEKVLLQSWPSFFVTGNLYRPKGEGPPGPGVLCPHGHWSGGRLSEASEEEAAAQIERGEERHLPNARYHLQARCAQLARMGCTVFHYDMTGYADSRQIGHAEGFSDVEALLRLQSAFGLQTWSSVRALDFLCGLPEVDPERIGVTGASGGGTQTFFLCAIDERPAVAFPAVMVSTAMQGGCVCENAPHLRVGTGNVEFAALMAPRPLAMTGANDWTLEIEAKGLPELRALYGLLGAGELVEARCFPQFEHNYNRVSRGLMYAWFDRHLGLGIGAPIEEGPIEPVLPAELSVFDAEHPLPEGAIGVEELRRCMTFFAEARMSQLSPRSAGALAEYRVVVGGALEVMLHSSLPGTSEIQADLQFQERHGPRLRRFFELSRADRRERVPAELWMPDGWNGTVVVAISENGRAGLFGADGEPLQAAAQILDAGAALLAPEVCLTGSTRAPHSGEGDPAADALRVDPERHADYAGYTWGYNRTLIAERAHDVLTAVAHARSLEGARSVSLYGPGGAGSWVILARALCGEAVGRTAAEASWDFDRIVDLADPNLLPGGLRYGGLAGFAALCAPGELRLLGVETLPHLVRYAYRAAGRPDGVRAVGSPGRDLCRWLAEPRP